jgi:hypothetical protein
MSVASPSSGEHGPENAWAGQGAVLLDIGGDVGALVVEMPASTVGLEVEIRPVDAGHDHGHDHLAHVAVVARPVTGGCLPSLVYGELPAGSYELFEKGRPNAVALRAEVIGGTVSFGSWPGSFT